MLVPLFVLSVFIHLYVHIGFNGSACTGPVTWKGGTCASRAQQGFTTCTKHRRGAGGAGLFFSSDLRRAWVRKQSKNNWYLAQMETLPRVSPLVNVVPVRMLLSDCADCSEGRRPTFSRFAGWLPLLPHKKITPSAFYLYLRTSILTGFFSPQQGIDDLQRVSMRGAQAASFAGFALFITPCTSVLSDHLLLYDDTQRKGACDRVEDHSAGGLGDGPPATDIKSDQRGNVVKAILLELEQLPGVALTCKWRQTGNASETSKPRAQQLRQMFSEPTGK